MKRWNLSFPFLKTLTTEIKIFWRGIKSFLGTSPKKWVSFLHNVGLMSCIWWISNSEMFQWTFYFLWLFIWVVPPKFTSKSAKWAEGMHLAPHLHSMALWVFNETPLDVTELHRALKQLDTDTSTSPDNLENYFLKSEVLMQNPWLTFLFFLFPTMTPPAHGNLLISLLYWIEMIPQFLIILDKFELCV